MDMPIICAFIDPATGIRCRHMFPAALVQRMTFLVSTLFGGYGVFCLVYSFQGPAIAARALILLGSAFALTYFAPRA